MTPGRPEPRRPGAAESSDRPRARGDAYRPGRPEPRGDDTFRPADRPLRERPAAGRPRVPNRPEPVRGRGQGERRPAPTRSRQVDRAADPAALDGAAAGSGRGPSGSSPPTGSTQVAPGTRQAAPVRTTRTRPAVSHRGRRTRRDSGARVDTRRRTKAALVIVLTLLAVALGRLVTIQTVEGRGLAATSLAQKTHNLVLHAQRGTIEDRNGNALAFTVAGAAIATRPADFQNDSQRAQVADILVAALGSAVDRATLLADMEPRAGRSYVYLAHQVMPAQATAIMARITKVLTDHHASVKAQAKLLNAVVSEEEDIRTRSDGTLAASVVGLTDRDGTGLSGIESKFNSTLQGKDGSRTVEVDNIGTAIPNTVSNLHPAVNGTDVRLTLDPDLQYTVQQQLRAQVISSKARGGCAIVKGISDGQVYAMDCYQPGKTAANTEKLVITTFEPGSVNKVVTFAAALDRGLITPTTHVLVPGQIEMGGREIHDDWSHDPVEMTATGILGKSSNVGTLMIAQKVGQTAFAQELAKYGLGKKTGIELPGEQSGSYPPESQWSGTSFANLPIGQGISMTLLQLVDMYQAIGNKGVLVPPTIIAGTSKDGTYTPSGTPSTTQVMKQSTAATLLDMLRGPIQSGDWYTRGTGPAAAIPGYQVAGKTGTAQQVDPVTKAYSRTLNTATFAGIVPADDPKYAIAIMLDAPVNGSEGGGQRSPAVQEDRLVRAAGRGCAAVADPVARRRPHTYDRSGLRASYRPASGQVAFTRRVHLTTRPPPAGLRPTGLSPVCRCGELAQTGRSAGAVGLSSPVAPDGRAEATVTGITLRAQDVRPGDLFAAVPGTRVHGAKFAGDAVRAGAAAILTDRSGLAAVLERGGAAEAATGAAQPVVPVLVVDDPRAVLGTVAAAVYGDPSSRLAVVGVTGTSGKTTTGYLLEAALTAGGHRSGLVGTVETRIAGRASKSMLTTPEAPDLQALFARMAEQGVEAVAMEVSSHALSLGRVAGTRFTVGAFTNLSQDHLDFHPDMESYFQAKAMLFDGRSAAGVVNIDDDYGRRLAGMHPEVVTVSADGNPNADWVVVETAPDGASDAAPDTMPDHAATSAAPGAPGSRPTSLRSGGQRFVVRRPTGDLLTVDLSLPGRFNVANAVLALACVDALGRDVEAAAGALRDVVVPGRMERVDAGQDFLVVVDYAHKPAALTAVLTAIAADTVGRLIVVVGAGGDRDAGKRPVMGQVAAEFADLLIITDDNPRSENPAAIRAAVLRGAVAEHPRVRPGTADIREIGDRHEAIRTAVAAAATGDAVVIAGKGHEQGQDVGGAIHPFSDRAEACAALAGRGWTGAPPAAAQGTT